MSHVRPIYPIGLLLATGCYAFHAGPDRDAASPTDARTPALDSAVPDRDAGLDVCAPLAEPCSGPNVLRGDLVLTSDADIAAAADVTCIEGNLVALHSALTGALMLPNLRRVTGSIQLAENEALTAITLPCLDSVDQRIHLSSNAALERAELPRLRSASTVLVQLHPRLRSVNLDALESMGSVFVIGNEALESFSLPRASELGELSVSGNAALGALEVRSLRRVRSLAIWQLARLTTLDLGSLESAEAGIEIGENESLRSVALGELRSAGELDLSGNPSLATLELPRLERVTYILAEDVALRSVRAPVLSDAESVTFYFALELEVLELTSLVRAGDLRIVGCSRSSLTIDLRALERVSRSLELSSCVAPSLLLPSLVSVGSAEGTLSVTDCRVRAIDAPQLTSIATVLSIVRNEELSSIELPSLRSAQRIVITDNPELSDCAMRERFSSFDAEIHDNDGAACR